MLDVQGVTGSSPVSSTKDPETAMVSGSFLVFQPFLLLDFSFFENSASDDGFEYAVKCSKLLLSRLCGSSANGVLVRILQSVLSPHRT